MPNAYKVIGLMSGTSLDGLDIAFCSFELVEGKWQYEIQVAETIPYSDEWKRRLMNVEHGSALDLGYTHSEYGHLLGNFTKTFIEKHKIQPDFVASHGHTIFHQPDKHLTFQIGDGSAIAAECLLPVISDFRTMDVALGGQGAPLVPIGDRLLFHEYDLCLNLGGFANISFEENGKRIAFDICPVNIVLNYLASRVGKLYDPSGEMAAIGNASFSLLSAFNQLPFYSKKPPKSLGKEWVVSNIFPLLNNSTIVLNDQLNTFCEHIAVQIYNVTANREKGRILITGGGTYNQYLLNRIQHHCKHQVVIPDNKTINFKEALIFAFLGVLRWREEKNCLKSVTGALTDSVGGSIFIHR